MADVDKKEMNNKKQNAFVRFLRLVFVCDVKAKLVALGSGAVLWILAVGLGIDSIYAAEGFVEFFQGFGENIAAQFANVGRACASVFDMLLLIVCVYVVLYLLRRNGASPIAKFIVILAVAILILSSSLIGLPVLGSIFSSGVLIIVIALLVMFPQELRRMMWKLASKSGGETFNVEYDCTEEELQEAVNDIVKAVLNMSKNDTGALVIITTQTVPQHILDSGTALGAQLSQPLIECLFNTNADLHDGAVFIRGNKILAAGCFLPLSQSQNLPKELGTRHRAALGISEQYDVLTIVVSEETGIISVARDGKLERYYDAVMLTDVIMQTYGLKANTSGGKKRRGRR